MGCKVLGDTELKFEKLAIKVIDGVKSLIIVLPIKKTDHLDQGLTDEGYLELIQVEV